MSLLKDFYHIISLEKTGDHALSATLELNAHHPIFGGHFPGIPVVPGVCMVQITKELLEKTLGKTTRLTASRNIKFLHVINPLENKTVVVKLDFKEETEGKFAANSTIVSEDGSQVFFKMRAVCEVVHSSSFIISYMRFNNKFKALKACVLIPTYNNAGTLGQIIRDVSAYSDDIIVVNDGSTDGTLDVLKGFDKVQVVSYPVNAGKGMALRRGFEYVIQKGYEYAITIDSDGQHFAKDIPVFLEKIEQQPGSIIIGARNMEQSSVPGKSSFGHRFSNFWFWVETGIKPEDTQSGYRLYPVQRLKDFIWYTKKYEFEIEVIVRAAWSGIPVLFVPVTVYYAPKETRVSHFRPFRDFSRVSVINTVLVIWAFLYIKPRDFIRNLSKKNFRDKLKEHLLSPSDSHSKKSASVAFGVFMGIVPIWGFQLAAAIGGAYLLRLNKALVILFANVSIPPMIPLILYLSYRCGAFWMGHHAVDFDFSRELSLELIHEHAMQYILGSVTLAFIASLFFGVLAFMLLKMKGLVWR